MSENMGKNLPEKIAALLSGKTRLMKFKKWEVCIKSRLDGCYNSVWEDNDGKIHLLGSVENRPGKKLLWMPDSVFIGNMEGDEKKRMKMRFEAQRELMDLIKKKKWDECLLKFKDKQIRKLIAEIMWGDEVAKIVSKATGVEVTFRTVGGKSAFESVFDSKGMSDEQILREIAKRHEALREATLRYHVQDSTSRGFKRKVLAGLE
jgi:hypothetical protein